jgi:peroxin-16
MPRPQTPHNRYTRFWSQKSVFYRRTALFLQMIQYTELLWEMAAKRKGEKVRWRVVVLLEAIKAICRLLLLRITNSRPLVTPALPERDIVPEEPLPTLDEDDEELSKTDQEWTMPRTGLTLPTLPNPSDISSYLLSKVLTADDIKTPTALLHRTRGTANLAEYLHILRPVIYAVALARSKSHGTNSWSPWLLGLAIDLSARQLRKTSVDGAWKVTGLEREEWNKRGWALGWWIMRSGFYDHLSESWIQAVVGSLKGRIGGDLIAGILDDYRYLWSEYYFSSATM